MISDQDSLTVTAISQKSALELDNYLMGDEVGYSLNQLVELAGLSASIAINEILLTKLPRSSNNVLVCCGPGNNGADGLVIARHLSEFGYSVSVLYPKPKSGDFYHRLFLLLGSYGVKTFHSLDDLEFKDFCVVIDAIFGISFCGPAREPFLGLIQYLIKTDRPVISLDVPSGWHVDLGPTSETFLQPFALISLAVPKLCASKFRNVHYLCGRFLPRAALYKFGINLPFFCSSNLTLDISSYRLVS